MNTTHMNDTDNFLRIVTEQWGTYVKVRTEADGTVRISGPMESLLDMISLKVPFRYNLTRPPDKSWGQKLPNGTFNGMFGMLQRSEVDMVLGPATVSADREGVSDFTTSLIYDPYRLVYQKPQTEDGLGRFLEPFSADIWLIICVSFLVVSSAYFIIAKYSNRIYSEVDQQLSVSSSFMRCFSQIPLQALKTTPQAHGPRVILFVWGIACFILAKSYEGTFIGIITIPKENMPIKTLKDLVSQTKIKWRVEHNSYIYDTFKFAETPLEQSVFDGLDGTYLDCFSNRSQLAEGVYLGICDLTSITQVISWDFRTNGKCRLYKTLHSIRETTITSAMKPKHPLLPKVNYWLTRIFEAGIFKQMVDKNDKSFVCATKNNFGTPTVKVSLKTFTGFFMVLVTGHTLGLIIFAAEIWWHNECKKRLPDAEKSQF